MRNALAMLWMSVLLLGCASMATDSRLMKFDDLSRKYDRALRWSEYELAYRLVMPQDAPKFNAGAYQSFKVTHYQTIHHSAFDEGKRIKRLVAVQYVLLERMSEHSLKFEEEWFYSEKDERWFMKSGFPQFR